MNPSTKRKDPSSSSSSTAHTRKKPWRTPKKNQPASAAPSINSGDAGIWATCDMHKEGKATAELRDLFEEYAVTMFGEDCLTTLPHDASGVDDAADNAHADDGGGGGNAGDPAAAEEEAEEEAVSLDI